MNYQKIYRSIIEKAKVENRQKSKDIYYENHHIIPKCLGGNDDEENLILLTAKEHFICHKLLVKIYPGNRSINFAFFSMSFMKNKNHRRINLSSRDYKYARELHAKNVSGEGNGMFRKSVYDLWIEKYGKIEADKRYYIMTQKLIHTKENNPMYGKNHSNKTKEKIRIKANGRKVTEETRRKMGVSQKERFNRLEEQIKIRNQVKGEGNPMYGRSAYSIWIEKYGKEEADKRKEEANEKRRKFWKNRKENLDIKI
jgi:hypothetical protein